MALTYRARKLWQSVASRLRAAVFRAAGVHLHGRHWLGPMEWPLRPWCITLHDGAAVERGVTLLATHDSARIILGEKTYINRQTIIDASELVEIGAQAMIGPFCYITDHDHSFRPGMPPGEGPLVGAPTRVGARCWIGAHVTILKGVTIGEDTVVGAGSVVTRSLPPRVVAVGNPARIVRELAQP
jgi:carbonic anhydrase/acetyltransferase-like protein (isoleucine patch superfamily)